MKFTTLSFIFIFFIANTKIVYSQSNINDKLNQQAIDSISESILTSKESDSVKISELNKIVSNHRFKKHTFNTIKKSIKIATSTKKSSLIADEYRILGNYYYYNSNLDSAEFYLKKSKNIIDNTKYPFINSAILNSLGGVYRKKGNITEAIKLVLESKFILETIDTLNLSKTSKRKLLSQQLILYNTLANFYNQMGDFSKAIDNYDKAYKKSLLLKATKYAGVILSNKGDLLLSKGNFQEALNVLISAKQLKIDGNAQVSSIANTNQNIGLALLKLGEYKLALTRVNEAIEYYEKNNLVSGLMESYVIRGRIFYETKNYKKAIDDCSRSKQLAIENGILETQEKSCLCLSEVYESIKDYKNAFINYKLYQKAFDSIYNEKNIKNITQLEMQYNFDKEKELQDLKNASKEKENKLTIQVLVFSILSLILIVGLLSRLFYIRHKSNKELVDKNKQISETLAINEILFKETHHRVKNNLQIISSLLNMQSRFLEDSKSKDIINDSQNRIKSMSLIHQKLYQEKNITGIETKAYFTELISSLALSYGIDTTKVSMNISIENILLDVDTAIPLGLILNELISNAFKHGINKETGEFSMTFNKPTESHLFLQIKDNGQGFPKNFNWNNSESYGMKLIHTLSNKLKADLVFKNKNGAEISMKITKFKLSQPHK
ncbi:MAG: histidine kinase dimerization/phosphoacceptor domain -containing protein [Lutibacter sp.]|uniref:tetratricopeptide repeat-containing sensor histidine kinase n=1 Tax=Lutibacter sp. TaxID=1925666 RepID=UPI00385829E7